MVRSEFYRQLAGATIIMGGLSLLIPSGAHTTHENTPTTDNTENLYSAPIPTPDQRHSPKLRTQLDEIKARSQQRTEEDLKAAEDALEAELAGLTPLKPIMSSISEPIPTTGNDISHFFDGAGSRPVVKSTPTPHIIFATGDIPQR